MDKDLVDYFIEQTNDRFLRLEEKIDEIFKFKWQIIGGSVLLSSVFSALVSMAYIYLNIHH